MNDAAAGRIALGDLRLIDLSVAIEHDAAGEMSPTKVEYVEHEAGARGMMAAFGCRAEDLVYSQGQGWAVENLSISSHTGTHVDAPYHYGVTSRGEAAKRIEEVPLEWCFGPGVVLDVRHKGDGEMISVEDVQEALRKIGYLLKGGEIILLHTGADKRWGTKDYFQQPGLGRESTLWLVEQGVHVIGIDAWTLDRPFTAMAADFKRTGDGRVLWPSHFAGITREYCQIEKLANLEQIPTPFGFYVSCFPVKIKDASAGWCRAVALVPR
jgi:kynurenine formamidase